MDPNAALDSIRRCLLESDSGLDDYDKLCVLEELATLVTGLDEWLSRGGFLPQSWKASK